MAGRGLSFGSRAAAAALVREALAPVLMVRALSGRAHRLARHRSRRRHGASAASAGMAPGRRPYERDGTDGGHRHVSSCPSAWTRRPPSRRRDRTCWRPCGRRARLIVDGSAVTYMSAAGRAGAGRRAARRRGSGRRRWCSAVSRAGGGLPRGQRLFAASRRRRQRRGGHGAAAIRASREPCPTACTRAVRRLITGRLRQDQGLGERGSDAGRSGRRAGFDNLDLAVRLSRDLVAIVLGLASRPRRLPGRARATGPGWAARRRPAPKPCRSTSST